MWAWHPKDDSKDVGLAAEAQDAEQTCRGCGRCKCILLLIVSCMRATWSGRGRVCKGEGEGAVLDNRMCSSSSSIGIKRRLAGIVVPKTRINIYDSLLLVFLVVSCVLGREEGSIYPLPLPLCYWLQRQLPVSVTRMCSTLPVATPPLPSLPRLPPPSHILVQVSCNWYVSLVPSSEFSKLLFACATLAGF